MRAQALPFFCVVCLLVSGCALVPDRKGTEFVLSGQEDAISSAMAHYAVGKLYEHDLGEHSYKTFEHLCKTGELDEKAYSKALRKAEKACESKPDSFIARVHLARIQHTAGLIEPAIANFQKAMVSDPKNPITYVDLSAVLFFQKRDTEAIAVLTKGIKESSNPRIAMDYAYRKGREFLVTEEVPRASACFIVVANVSKTRGAQLHHMLGELYEKLGYADEAAKSYRLAIENKEPLPNSYLRLAAIELKSNHEKALETLLKASSRMPDEPAIHMALGYLHNSEQDTEKAAASFEKTIILAEKEGSSINLSPGFFLDTASIFELLNRLDKADEIYVLCIENFPKNHGILNYVAYAWAERGVRLKDALKFSQKSLELDPGNGAYIDTLGWIFYQQKNYEEALTSITKAQKLMKDDPTITEHLGDVLNAMGKKDQALALWKQSYTMDATNPLIREKLEQHGVDVEKIPKAKSE